MREVNRKVLVMAVALFAVVISASIAPALATVTYREIKAGGRSGAIEVPGEPKFSLEVETFYRSSDHGARDRIWVFLYFPGSESAVPVAVASDGGEEDLALWQEVWAGAGQMLAAYRNVKRWHIQVCRIGKLVIAYWTKPIECVLPPPLKAALGIDSWTLPPGMLFLKGYGEVDTTGNTVVVPSGFTITGEPNRYDAKGTFFCPSWRFCGSLSDDARMSTCTVMTFESP